MKKMIIHATDGGNDIPTVEKNIRMPKQTASIGMMPIGTYSQKLRRWRADEVPTYKTGTS